MLARESGQNRSLQDGFTLVELLLVIVLIAVLAAIAMDGLASPRERTHLAVLRSDIASFALVQELFYHANSRYAELTELAQFSYSDGVEATLNWHDDNGFAVILTHSAIPGRACGYFMGDAPAGSAGPASVPGQVACD